MARTTIVTVNGVYQQINQDFVTKGNTIIFKTPPTTMSLIEFTTFTNSKNHSVTQWNGDGIRTNFPFVQPRVKFAVVPHTGKDWVPEGHAVVDVDTEIDLWIRENCPASDWKWADQLDEAIGFNMSRLIVKESLLTFIATKWSA